MKYSKKILLAFFIFSLSISFGFSKDYYWESPEKVTATDTRFPSSVSATVSNDEGKTADEQNSKSARTNKSKSVQNEKEAKAFPSAVFWEEIDTEKKRLYISAKTTTDGVKWREIKRFAGPIKYSGEVPDVYSSAINSNGIIAVSALTDTNEISVYISDDDGKSFHRNVIEKKDQNLVAPRIFSSSNGFVIFASSGQNESFSLLYSISKDGSSWSSFKIFEPSANLRNPFVPYLVTYNGVDVVTFQAQYSSAARLSYQIYSSVSTDNLKSWSEPVMLSDQNSLPSTSTNAFSNYNNQRPYLLATKDGVFIAWERTWYSSENSNIWFAELNQAGTIKSSLEQISASGNANRPILFYYDNLVNLIWFDTRSGIEKVYRAVKSGSLWQEEQLSKSAESSSFAYPIISNNGKELSFVWQQKPSKKETDSRIVMLLSDHTVNPPIIIPRSFREDSRYSSENAIATIKMSEDSSGVAGYSWIWTQNEREEPPKELMNMPSQTELKGSATEDGLWYFKARELDYAGNWSSSSSVSYYKDTTPPLAPSILTVDTDDNGLATSNTFNIEWQPNIYDDDVAGYTWSLNYISTLPYGISETKRHPLTLSADEVQQKLGELLTNKNDEIQNPPSLPKYIQSSNTSATYRNRRNGLYVFSVAAIDHVGNIGPSSSVTLLLDKYIPSTYITTVNATPDQFGNISLSIYGGGYTYDGTISTIYIDKDGAAPYDRVLTSETGGFRVNSDNRITGISLSDMPEGSYRIGLLHTDRGLYFSGRLLSITEMGTVKIQNTYSYEPNWSPVVTTYKYHINVATILLCVLFALSLLGLFGAVRGLSLAARDAVTVKKEVKALITGDIMPQEKKIKSAALKQKGVSLKIKLAAFTIALVFAIVALVSIPLGYIMINTQEKTLSKGLSDRVNVLLDSLATGAKAYLPTSDILQLSYLPEQTSALPEAKYATITGLSNTESNTSLTYIWATNDNIISAKIDTSTLTFGTTKLSGETIENINKKCLELDKEAQAQAGEIAQNISELNKEGVSLALKTDSESVKRREEISTVTTELTNRLNSTLTTLSSKGAGSYPSYDSTRVDRNNTTYLFYKPILYRQGSEQTYVRGIVFVEINTETLVKSVTQAVSTIVYTALVIALIAVLIGFLGSLLVASIIVKPIRKLADHVAMIRDTEDKETLQGKDIQLKSHDEIGLLGETINEMTHGLSQAAAVTKNLIVGKDIQTKFIPLQTDDKGNTLTTGSLKEKGIELFSYYAGADELSGDYFDYKKIDDHHYAIIKCDVSGHGVPAALIMVEVATLFLNYFQNWSFQNKSQGVNLSPVVGKINDLLESRGFKGRFAAFTLCVMDTLSGECWFCNAGDNIVQIYNSATKKKDIITLQETPAAGMFPTDMVDMKGGYKVSKLTLKKNDVLFLYTDGIEEAKRNFRDANLNPIKCEEPGLKEGDPHGNHSVGETNEEMTPERVTGIIESVYAKKKFSLSKYHNPVPNEQLDFDFTNCDPTAKNAIMALVSVEKIFRIYKPLAPKDTDKIKVDRKIDSFLRQHFLQYSNYCMNHSDVPNEPCFVYYEGVLEDPQYDDLTLIGIKKE